MGVSYLIKSVRRCSEACTKYEGNTGYHIKITTRRGAGEDVMKPVSKSSHMSERDLLFKMYKSDVPCEPEM